MAEVDPYEKIEDLAERSGSYPVKAFLFVLAVLEHAHRTLGREGHMTGGEVCAAAKDLAVRDYGPAAKMVLNGWGFESTLDIGRVVYLMIEGGLLSKTEEDSLDDFRDVFDFETEFVRNYRY
jgi:uncharacterized repeat protein (TIGR04138 family)